MSKENEILNHNPKYEPDDPEYYLNEIEKNNPGDELILVLGNIAINITRSVILSILKAPIKRVSLLQSAEGELIKNKRLPRGGFGGIRGCFYYIITKEGFLGLFRACFTEMILSLPAYIIQNSLALGITLLQNRLNSIYWSTILGLAAPGLRVLFASPIVGYRNTVVCNYTADIIAPRGIDDESNNKDKEEAYLYISASEVSEVIQQKYGWKWFLFNGLDVDIAAVYAQSLTLRLIELVIMPKIELKIQNFVPQPGRRMTAIIATALGVHLICGIVFQPFQVLRTRMTILPTKVEPKTQQQQQQQKKRKIQKYRWFWRYAKDIVRQDGITALWAGLRMRLLWDMGNILFRAMIRH